MSEPTGQLTSSTVASNYIGRFAPSPTGPLHTGSLVAALASWLDARHHGGHWLVRMEDLDPPRESPEAADAILDALDKLGLHWDGPVLYQSSRTGAYREAINTLRRQHAVFSCHCSRGQIREAGGVYPGTCRTKQLAESRDTALRCRVDDETVGFEDLLQGARAQALTEEVGDFVIRRRDGLFAYQLAVVVDDAFQQVSHVIRGMDLLDSTPRQIWLQRLLGLPQPLYGHIPIIVNSQGQKLSKQHMARPIDPDAASSLLFEGLVYLRQEPDPALKSADRDDVLAWGTSHWRRDKLAGITRLREFEHSV